MGLEAPRRSLLLWGSLEFTHRGSQTLQERERGGDDVCGVLRPDGAKAAEPEHPTGELGGRGQDTEFGVWPPCPHISPSPHPQELTWSLSLPPTPPTKVQSVQQRQGPATFPGENLTSGSLCRGKPATPQGIHITGRVS